MTLNEAIQRWREALIAEGVRPNTVETYLYSVRNFARWLQGRGIHDLQAVKPEHVRQYLARRRETRREGMVANDYRFTRQFWRWCVREGLVQTDVFANLKPPKRQYRLLPALTPEQVQALLNATDGTHWIDLRNRALILLLLDTGMRIHEAHALKVKDALSERVLIRGKGGRYRTVYLSPETRHALECYLEACPYPLKPESPLWFGERGAISLAGLKLALARIGERARLPFRLGAHAFRRTFAVWALREGCDFERLRRLMGHANFSMLMRYLPLNESDLQQAHARYSPVRKVLGQ